MIRLTKEKILALICGLVAIVMLAGIRLPRTEATPKVPDEEQARAYRAISTTPRLTPEQKPQVERDPFQTKDAWAPAKPALLATPPAVEWPRAQPGGVTARPRSPRDRLLVTKQPVELKENQ